MAKTVYVLGAGINRNIKDIDQVKPPMANDLFKQALRHEMLDSEEKREELAHVFEYIKRHWGLSVDDLREKPFNIEECFTLLQQQRLDALSRCSLEWWKVSSIEESLSILLTRILAHVEGYSRGLFSDFAEKVIDERAALLTFNYDNVIESEIKSVKDQRGEEWELSLTYGVTFSEIHSQFSGTTTEGSVFYKGKQLYEPPILKLHGSMNWFEHTSSPVNKIDYWGSAEEAPDSFPENSRKGEVRLVHGHPHIAHGFDFTQFENGYVLKPLIVTPILYKDLGQRREGEEESGRIIRETWKKAREELRDCKKLVIVGYSFPATDFEMRRLFLEAFAEGPPDELVCVNPDRSVATEASRLCHQKPVVREDLQEFLAYPSG